ncbi:MFS transporter [Brooklawnia cerclae]|uniref:MFS family permease n=1 Tax=Brooklawnia cerclae TaxID=349934 RepID=A0ABX0SPE3_9ACTN|nr:MFS transporter [Brooklawnia cerclae]NIH58676.1 MFS family permease [Brooklawnia cerclae]
MTDELPQSGPIRVPGTDRVYYRRLILIVLLSLLAMTLMAISAINVALPTIEETIGASPADLQWMLSGYALAFGIVLVAAGRVGDVMGRSTCFVIGVSVFTLASLACALSHDPMTLNAARVVQGVGAGIASPQVNGMIVQYFDGHRRARAFAMFGMTVSVSVAVAPLLTGLSIGAFGPDLGWRVSFFWNVPFGIAAVVLAFRWLPFGQERERRIARAEGRKVSTHIDLDPVGMALLSLAVLCVMAPFMLKQAISFLLIPAGIGLLAAWAAWERRYARIGREPMVDLSLFEYRSFTHGMAVSGTQFIGGTSIFVILALYLQSGIGASALGVGLLGVPNAIASALSSMWSGERVLYNGRRTVVTAFVIYIVGILACIVMGWFTDPAHGGLDYRWLTLPLVLCGWGVGTVNSSTQTLSQQHIPAPIAGTAGAVKQVAERIGTALGNAMITAVFFSLTAVSWSQGFMGAFAVIAVVLVLAFGWALFDLRTLGDPGPPPEAA